MNLDLSFYFAIFLRRLHYFIIAFALVSAASIAAAFLMPPVYYAQSVLLVESSQIPGPLAAPTIQAQALEKLQIVQNRLMTRSNLLEIAKKLRAFKDIDKMSPDEIVQAMRDHTSIFTKSGAGQATLMTIGFDAETGVAAAGVVNEYVTLILAADAEMRVTAAEDTVAFFNQEVKTLSAELDKLSAQILDFQNRNADALPSTLGFRLTQQAALQTKLDTAERDITTLEDQKTRLIAIYNSTGQVSSVTPPQTSEARQLAALTDQLNTQMASLSNEHPRVKAVRLQIALLEEVVRTQSQAPTATAINPQATMLDVQIADLDSRIKAAIDVRDQTTKQLAVLQDTIDRTPANQVALDALNRDYSNIQGQFNAAVSRQSQAAAGERIELLSKGERITVVDSATVPDSPTKPNRVMIAGGGMFAGAALGVGLIALMELLNRAVRRPKDLIRSFGITPIVTIPYIRTPSETMMRRMAFVAVLLLAVVGIPALIYAVHVYYQPLDIIVGRVASKFGIRL